MPRTTMFEITATADSAKGLQGLLNLALKASENKIKPDICSVPVRDSAGRIVAEIYLAVGHGACRLMSQAAQDEIEYIVHARSCRYCGCTDEIGCEEGCAWIAKDVCSHPACVALAEKDKSRKR